MRPDDWCLSRVLEEEMLSRWLMRNAGRVRVNDGRHFLGGIDERCVRFVGVLADGEAIFSLLLEKRGATSDKVASQHLAGTSKSRY